MSLWRKTKLWKPSKEIFEYVLALALVEPEDSLFIDDVLRNVVATQNLGMHAIQFTNEKQFFEEIRKYNLPLSS